MISLKDYLTASGSYPARETDKECTDEVKANANVLLVQVNALLKELGVQSSKVSSGFRPSEVNANTPHSAKKSLHQVGLAVDILDSQDQALANMIKAKPELLKKYNLWMENPSNTKGKFTNWVHLDVGIRTDRPIRIFNP